MQNSKSDDPGKMFQDSIESFHRSILKELEDHKHSLGERVKELNCLYKISSFVEDKSLSFDELMQNITDILPPSWQYPEITCSRIMFDDKEYTSENFSESQWKQSGKIYVNGIESGKVEIFYLEKKKNEVEGPFLAEERNLINVICERLGNIIETVRSEKAVIESEKHFRDLFNESPIGIEVYDRNGILLDANPASLKMFGVNSVEDVIGFKLLENPNLPADKVEFLRQFQRVRYEVKYDFDKVRKNKLFETSKSGFMYLDVQIIPRFDINDKCIGYTVQTVDITDRVASEKDKISIERRHTEAVRISESAARLASLGVISGGITHEINQPLNTIMLNADTIRIMIENNDETDLSRVLPLVDDINWGAKRINDIVKHMRTFFTTPSLSQLEPTELNNSVKKALELVKRQLEGHSIELKQSFYPDNLYVESNPLQIEQIVINLVSNAVKSLDKKRSNEKRIEITTDMSESGIVMSVKDNGCGLEEVDNEKLFDPFYSTDKEGAGTGLGLAIVKMFINRSGGSIAAKNVDQGGAIFNIHFPVNNEANNG